MLQLIHAEGVPLQALMDMIYLVCSNIKIQLPNRPILLRIAA